MSESRRDAIRKIALALTAAGSIDELSAQHVHAAANAAKKGGVYKPKVFTDHEWKTVSRLAELIVPADEHGGSAVEAGAPEFIDLLCSQNKVLSEIYTGGIAWLDAEMHRRYGKEFVDAGAGQQTEMLDALVEAEKVVQNREQEEAVYGRAPQYRSFAGYTTSKGTDLAPGARFFDWVRKMSVDAYYTSPIGIKDLNFVGNGAVSKYEVPKESLEYALKRSPA